MDIPEIGRCDLCFNVRDVKDSYKFYTELGFKMVEGDLKENWAVLSHRGFRIGLYNGHIDKNLLNFRGGDPKLINDYVNRNGFNVSIKFKEGEKGGGNLTVLDPDGYAIFFDTHYTELEIPMQMKSYLEREKSSELGVGEAHIVLTVQNIATTKKFYESLGFITQGESLVHGNVRLLLRPGNKKELLLLFKGDNETKQLVDPDGTILMFE